MQSNKIPPFDPYEYYRFLALQQTYQPAAIAVRNVKKSGQDTAILGRHGKSAKEKK